MREKREARENVRHIQIERDIYNIYKQRETDRQSTTERQSATDIETERELNNFKERITYLLVSPGRTIQQADLTGVDPEPKSLKYLLKALLNDLRCRK